eukprot:GHVU01114080.1.p2 GENE.GHVU01114080.1~~GHVU01114080.1.p2  ORF type:complete len:102 (-),score=17.31 GHVU01114080.1:1290-1595(-)
MTPASCNSLVFTDSPVSSWWQWAARQTQRREGDEGGAAASAPGGGGGDALLCVRGTLPPSQRAARHGSGRRADHSRWGHMMHDGGRTPMRAASKQRKKGAD